MKADVEVETDAPPGLERMLFDATSMIASETERDRFLGYVCRGDPAMLKRVRTLLLVQGEADDFFDFDPEVDGGTDESDGLGVGMGRYRLIERIGAGGCGVVYLAEQSEPVRRKVALKIIRLGLDSAEAIARFEAERQALASMNHPSIARVLDGGTTASGRPFFVMELVAGERLTDYCDSRMLDIRTRLRLFLDICRAIQHAHQKGVVHRDIKPSNILVETHESIPVPKVIDFGMALAGGVNAGQSAADGWKILGTPGYVSPEQAAGEAAVDTRSDVFSLGILLGELLAGPPRHVPADLWERPVEEIRATLRSARPELPSAALRGLEPAERAAVLEQRGVTEKRLLAWCERDLDWVVGRAVAPDPKDRYDTVNGLAMDIGRWLKDEPLQAHPQNRGYRFRKLVRRNRMVFAAGTLAAIGLVGGATIATHLFIREKAARAEQEMLRERAEIARAAESGLRKKSEMRARVTQAAVRINYDDLRQADALLATVPLEHTPATVEAVSAYRGVAEWHLLEGRHEEAGLRFRAMATAFTSVDDTDSDTVSRNLLPAASAVCLSGAAGHYEGFRTMAIDRFAGTTHPVVAEQVLKACLLLPADEAALARLAPLAELVEAALADSDSPTARDPDLAAWSCFALALMSYRQGEDARATEWALRSLSRAGINPARSVSAKIVLGLVELRAGRESLAGAYLDSAEAEAGDRLGPLRSLGGTSNGFWFDWVNIQLWLREAGRPTEHPW